MLIGASHERPESARFVEALRPARGRVALVRVLGESRRLRGARDDPNGHAPGLRHPDAAAERHGLAAHGPRAALHARGRAHALAPHARLQHALAAGHRSRGHRDADRRRAPARSARARRATTSGARSSSSACGSGRTRAAVASRSSSACSARRPTGAARKFTMDPDMSRAVREAFVRLYEEGPHLPRDAPHQLVPGVPHGALAISRSRTKRARTASSSSSRTRSTATDEEIVVATTRPETMLGDTAVAVHPDDPRYKHLHGKKLVHPFVDRHDPDHHRRDPGRPEVRHRRREGHARARLQRLRDGQAPQARGDQHLQPRRHAERERRPVRRARPQSARARAVKKALDEKGLARGTKPHMLTLPRCQRSGGVVEPMISTQWFLKMKAMAERGARSGRTTERVANHPRGVGEDVRPLPREHPGLVHLASALVGAPDPRVARAERRDQGRARRGRPSAPRRRLEAGPRRARHVVLERALAVLDARLAGQDARARRSSIRRTRSSERSRDGLRHPLLLGRPHDDVRAPLHEGGAVPPRAPLRPHRRRDRRQDEQGEGQRDRSARSDPRRRRSTRWSRRRCPARPRKRRWRSSRRRTRRRRRWARDSRRSAPTRCASRSRRSRRRTSASRSRRSASRATATSSNKIWNATRFSLEQLEGASDAHVEGARARRTRSTAGSCRGSRQAARIGDARASRRSASTRRRTSSIASSGTTSATGTSRSRSRARAGRPYGDATRRKRRSRTCSRRRFDCSTRSCRSSPRSCGSALPNPEKFASIAFGPYPDEARLGDEAARGATWRSLMDGDRRGAHACAASTTSSGRTRSRSSSARAPDDFVRELAAEIGFRLAHCERHGPFRRPRGGGSRAPGHIVSVVRRRRRPIEVLVGLKGLVETDKELARIERELKRIDKDIAGDRKKLCRPELRRQGTERGGRRGARPAESMEEAAERLRKRSRWSTSSDSHRRHRAALLAGFAAVIGEHGGVRSRAVALREVVVGDVLEAEHAASVVLEEQIDLDAGVVRGC